MQNNDLAKKNKRVALAVFTVVFAMVGLAFASVPLYDLFCRVTGFGGTTQEAESLPDVILDREVTIKFNADTGRNFPWHFAPQQRQVTVKLGQEGLTAYTARNRMDEPVTGTAVYNVSPPKAGQYFHKIQCFCFDRQTLAPQQSMNMPVIFFVDPAMADDPNMEDVNVITLSYTFYEADSEELDTALEAVYTGDIN